MLTDCELDNKEHNSITNYVIFKRFHFMKYENVACDPDTYVLTLG